jgi:ABC-type glycerol-3-phosphate transport system substrate-binding protein
MNHLAKKRVVAAGRQPGKFSALTLGALAILIGQLFGAPHVDLQFWDMVWGPPEYIDTGKALVEQFNREHPDITITYRSIPWNNWYQTFVTAIGSGTAPDISTGAGYQAVQLYGQGAILPIDDIIEKWRKNGKLNDFLPRPWRIRLWASRRIESNCCRICSWRHRSG